MPFVFYKSLKLSLFLPSFFYYNYYSIYISKVLVQEGIRNILALRGDKSPSLQKKEDFEHASDLISYLKQKEEFCIAGACYPLDIHI